MAIDNAAKRFSALRVANPMLRTLPVPDGTVDAGDRIHVLGGYGGLFGDVPQILLTWPLGGMWTNPARGAWWTT